MEKIPDSNTEEKIKEKQWQHLKEKILMVAGIFLMTYEAIVPPFVGQKFYFQVMLAGLALCGVSISQWKDRK